MVNMGLGESIILDLEGCDKVQQHIEAYNLGVQFKEFTDYWNSVRMEIERIWSRELTFLLPLPCICARELQSVS